MKILPAIDLIGGKTVRLEQGQYHRKLSYDILPVEAAIKWESMGAELLHVVDLDGAKDGAPVNLAIVEEIVKNVKVPVEVGGGYRNKEAIQRALDKGVYRVIVGSRAFEDISFAKECMKNFNDKVIFSIDVKDFRPSVRGWKKEVDIDVPTVLSWFYSFGAREVIYTDIKSDGTLSGPNIEALESVLKEVDVKVISAGGVKTVDHIKGLKKLEHLGLSGAIVGRALYEGTIDLKEAIDAGKTDNSVS